MKIMVAVKRVIDPYVKIRVKPDESGVETQNMKMSMNPFDEIALEEAIRLKEKNLAEEILAVSIGSVASQETLRHALALGADRAILVQTDRKLCSLHVAKILSKLVDQEQPELVLLGKQAIDNDSNQVPQMLAAKRNWPQATFASSITLDAQSAQVTREVDGGLETIKVGLPAVISVDLRLNEPRYASLPNIMKAKKKPLDIVELDSLGLELREHIDVLATRAPAVRSAGIKLESVKELIDKLRHEEKILK